MVTAFPFHPAKLALSATAALLSALPALPAQAQVPGAATQDLGGSVLQLLFGLLAILALMFLSLWLLKRLAGPRGEAGGLMRVVAGTAVGARERVVVLEIGSTWLVLGVAPGRVTALAELPRSELPADTSGTASDFASRLRQMVNRGNAR